MLTRDSNNYEPSQLHLGSSRLPLYRLAYIICHVVYRSRRSSDIIFIYQ